MEIKLNPDTEFVKMLKLTIEKNDGYCPCRIEKTDDTKCPCKDFRDMKEGHCHCGLFIKYQ